MFSAICEIGNKIGCYFSQDFSKLIASLDQLEQLDVEVELRVGGNARLFVAATSVA
jgi:hypothetical protein